MSNQVCIVTDDPSCLSKHTIDLGGAIGTTNEDFISFGVNRKGLDSPSKGTRGNRGNVVDEAFGFNFGELDGHVAGTGDQVLAIDGKDRRARPVLVGALVEFLVAFEVKGSNRVVCHA